MSAETSTTPTTVPSVKKVSPWLAHIAAYRAEHPDVSYKQALVAAKGTYTSANPNAKPRAPSPFPHKDTKSCQSGYFIL